MRRLIGALILLLALAAGATAGDAVVIEGTGSRDGLRPGSVFPSGKPITLLGGEHLRVLLQDGRLVDVAGPFRGPVAAVAAGGSDDDPLATISALLVGRRGTASVIGASRETAFIGPPDVWVIATDASGARCVDGTLRLWRHDPSAAASVVARGAGGEAGPLRWPAGEATLVLPPALAAPGPLVVTVGEVVHRFQLRIVPPDRDLAEPGSLLVWFAEMGCERQAGLLLDRLTGN